MGVPTVYISFFLYVTLTGNFADAFRRCFFFSSYHSHLGGKIRADENSCSQIKNGRGEGFSIKRKYDRKNLRMRWGVRVGGSVWWGELNSIFGNRHGGAGMKLVGRNVSIGKGNSQEKSCKIKIKIESSRGAAKLVIVVEKKVVENAN